MIGPKMEHMCLFKTPSADVSDNLFTTIGLVCGGTGKFKEETAIPNYYYLNFLFYKPFDT